MRRIFWAGCLVFLLAGYVSGENTGTVRVDVLSKTGLSWDGNDLPAYPEGSPEITIVRITIPPGTQLPRHTHPVINAGVLISGALTVVTEQGNVLYLKAGEAIVEVVNTWHYGKNEGDTPAEIIVFYAGTAGGQITVGNQNTTGDPQKQ